MQENKASEGHIYQRQLDPDAEDSLAMIARLIQPGNKVLDLGAGTGVLGAYLSENKQCTVDGVEGFEAQAEIASPGYRRLEVANLENCHLSTLFPETYNVIVCADVLEHLKNPEYILKQLAERLTAEGRILLSIPNIAYAGAIAGLMAGEFRYRPEGILDQTHLRFFTRQSLIDFIHQHGFTIRSFDRVRMDLRDSEFRDHLIDSLSPSVITQLTADDDALSYQFIVEISPGSADDDAPITSPEPLGLHFVTQLYWRFPEDQYSEAHSTSVLGKIGELEQKLELVIPKLTAQPEILRLDLADRPGFVRIRDLSLIDSNGNSVWKWDKQGKSLSASQGTIILGPLMDRSSITILIESESSFLELPLSANILAKIQAGGKLLLELSFPQSADYMALLPRVEMLEQQRRTELEERERLIRERDELLEEQNQEITRRGKLVKEKDQMLELRNQQMSECEDLIKEREDVIKNKDESLEEQNQEITRIFALISERDQILETRTGQMQERENLIQNREKVIEAKDNQLKELNQAKDKQLKELNQEVIFRGELIQERDEWLELRNQQKDEHEKIIQDQDRLLSEKDTLLSEHEQLLSYQASMQGWLKQPLLMTKSWFSKKYGS